VLAICGASISIMATHSSSRTSILEEEAISRRIEHLPQPLQRGLRLSAE
jgi:hypothetical protein